MQSPLRYGTYTVLTGPERPFAGLLYPTRQATLAFVKEEFPSLASAEDGQLSLYVDGVRVSDRPGTWEAVLLSATTGRSIGVEVRQSVRAVSEEEKDRSLNDQTGPEALGDHNALAGSSTGVGTLSEGQAVLKEGSDGGAASTQATSHDHRASTPPAASPTAAPALALEQPSSAPGLDPADECSSTSSVVPPPTAVATQGQASSSSTRAHERDQSPDPVASNKTDETSAEARDKEPASGDVNASATSTTSPPTAVGGAQTEKRAAMPTVTSKPSTDDAGRQSSQPAAPDTVGLTSGVLTGLSLSNLERSPAPPSTSETATLCETPLEAPASRAPTPPINNDESATSVDRGGDSSQSESVTTPADVSTTDATGPAEPSEKALGKRRAVEDVDASNGDAGGSSSGYDEPPTKKKTKVVGSDAGNGNASSTSVPVASGSAAASTSETDAPDAGSVESGATETSDGSWPKIQLHYTPPSGEAVKLLRSPASDMDLSKLFQIFATYVSFECKVQRSASDLVFKLDGSDLELDGDHTCAQAGITNGARINVTDKVDDSDLNSEKRALRRTSTRYGQHGVGTFAPAPTQEQDHAPAPPSPPAPSPESAPPNSPFPAAAKKKKRAKSTEKGDGRVHCVCETIDRGNRFMIACDRCDIFFHPSCIGLNDSLIKDDDPFVCPWCAHQSVTGSISLSSSSSQPPRKKKKKTKLASPAPGKDQPTTQQSGGASPGAGGGGTGGQGDEQMAAGPSGSDGH